MTVVVGDFSSRPFRLTVERAMLAGPDVLFRAWTEQFDRWFAAPGSVLMKSEVNVPFYFETQFEGGRHPHYGRFLRLEKDRLGEVTSGNGVTEGGASAGSGELSPESKGTRLRLTHAGFPNEESRKRHEEAWPMVLKQMDERM